jgi:hypothetical protein
MSPMPQSRGGKVSPASNVYTAFLATAVGALLATVVYVAYTCQTCYGTIFKLP